ncbi:head completion/stabilization protein [Pseudomonas monteilii]|uniref:head completion/stabilization protein n=1 Tax=Pseudomonas TaxID=286 RepID=UPI000EFA7A5C|nr:MULTISPECIES: head completion/stabilization protein [Pseudomonas]AYO02554.1 head protein [Pseudomonas sp. LTGT-11-2Z]MCE0927886.1 head completion/stabilization protein [Pseudomonas monteilii]MCT8188298.1 head completion/stabilization protein [Pseudomonas monteilii]UPK83787.1 head protein [Pseudomonas sp. A2]WJN88615.1 head completion/stabilization protein [Pseudomonas monteilii]
MSFSGKPSTVVDQTIENNGFWPDLSLAEYQKAYRLPGEYLSDTLVTHLNIAMGEVNQDLTKLMASWRDLGITEVATADSLLLEERAYKVTLYKRAVYCRAKATALTDFATVTRREVAENTGKEAPERAETYLSFSQQAVRALQGRSRITAALL